MINNKGGVGNQEEDSNLLDSDSNINPNSPQRDDSDSQNQSEFLNRVEDLLNGADKKKSSKHQILLQAQIVELQNKCNYLSLTNQKLASKLNQMIQEEYQSNSNSAENSKIDESSYLGDISEMQNQFGEMQGIIKSYREQLQSYQKLISDEKDKYDMELALMREQIGLKDKKINSLQGEIWKMKNQIFLLTRKNEELILQIEQINENKYKELNESFSRLDNSVDREFQQELEKIIEKLAAELEYERGIKKKLNEELKRMSKQVEKQQKTIQRKNQIVYELQLKLLGNNKIKHLDNSWMVRNHSPKNHNIRQERSFQSQYFNNESYHHDKKMLNSNSMSHISLLSDLSQLLMSSIEVPLFISYRIIQIYEQTEDQKLPRVKMTQSNIQVDGINIKNITKTKVLLLSTKQPRIICRNAQEYFWSTFDLVESLIIPLSLEELPKIKKSMLELSISSRNRKKLGTFVQLSSSIYESLNL